MLEAVEAADRGASVSVRAPRGTELSCRGWPQEAALRMLMNNLDPDVAENPDELVVYGGTGRAARSWEAFDAIVRTLRSLRDDETLLVQSGKPVGVFTTHEWSPRVLIANSNLVPEWATWEEFRRLEALGLTMYGQMTAGSWIYIGSQGILQGTYECFAEIARRRHGGSLAGTITLTAGLGGMGGAQPLAITMNGGVALCVEVDRHRIERRLETRYLDEVADDLDDAIARCMAAKTEGRALSVGLEANAADVLPALLARGFEAEIVTDQTSAHDPLGGYVPNRMSARGGERASPQRPRRVRSSLAGCDRGALRGDGRLPRCRQRGVRLRQQPAGRGSARRLRARVRIPGVRPGVHPAAVLRGEGAIPLGCAVRRPRGHRGDRSRGARGVPRRRAPRALDPLRVRADRVPGSARQDLLARIRRAPAPRAALQRDGPLRRAAGTDRDRSRPPRLRLGRVALSRDRGDGR